MHSLMFFADAAAGAAGAAPQASATVASTAPAGGTTGANSSQAGATAGGMGMLVPMLLIFGIFYFMMIRPQQRKEKERLKMIRELRAGQRILFAGGLVGTVVEVKEKEGTFLVEIAPKVVIEIARNSVSSVLKEGETPPADDRK